MQGFLKMWGRATGLCTEIVRNLQIRASVEAVVLLTPVKEVNGPSRHWMHAMLMDVNWVMMCCCLVIICVCVCVCVCVCCYVQLSVCLCVCLCLCAVGDDADDDDDCDTVCCSMCWTQRFCRSRSVRWMVRRGCHVPTMVPPICLVCCRHCLRQGSVTPVETAVFG